MYIQRTLGPVIKTHLFKGKAIVILGARQVGKSTLMAHLTNRLDLQQEHLNCDDPVIRNMLTDISDAALRLLIGKNKIITIDEAQRVENIGLVLKRIIDTYPDTQVIASGSSSFQLLSSINEPLTGRKFEYTLYPISTQEIYETFGLATTLQLLNFRLIYGSYPDILTNQEDARELLLNLADSYLYKDILELDNVRKPALLQKILVAVALQLGSEVSYNEVARTTGADVKTVERYIDLLEKCFVIYTMPALSRNLRNELKKSKKIYFYDNGIRNAIIQNYAPVNLRDDMGALWENFFVMERMKYNSYRRQHAHYYFWRTTDQQEIDLIEECDGQFTIFEMKWNKVRANARFPEAFMRSYTPIGAHVVTPDNYTDFLLSSEK